MSKKKRFLSLVIFASIGCASCMIMFDHDQGEPSRPGHPAREILLSFLPGQNEPAWISPYIVNLLALERLRKDGPGNWLESYIEWYFDHLNYPDKYGCTGSIYDWTVAADGSETSLEECDSLDSYAATFLILLERSWRLGGSDRQIRRHRKQLRDIAYLILHLQQENGLSLALPDQSEQYLMDNCECLGGLSAYARLAEVFDPEIAEVYRFRAKKLHSDIRRNFYIQSRRHYAWEIDNGRPRHPDWRKFYPDAYAQLFPVLYGTVQNHAERLYLWKKFKRNHKRKISAMPLEQRIVIQWTEEVIQHENHDHAGNPA